MPQKSSQKSLVSPVKFSGSFRFYVVVIVAVFGLVGAVFLVQSKAATVSPVGIPSSLGNWNLIFEDEFNGTALDTTKWSSLRGWSPGYGNPFNPDIEGAFFKPANTSVANGNLVLTLKKEPTSGYAYSSGMVQSGEHFTYKYGYAEARVKVPNCSGCWPAFWTLDAPIDDHWPPEIDIFEFFDTSASKRPAFNYHWTDGVSYLQSGPTGYGSPNVDYTTDYHVYGMYWDDKKVQVYIDGQPGPTYTDAATITKAQNYIILNFSTYKNANPTSGSQMLVDYVRVWQLGGPNPAPLPPPAPAPSPTPPTPTPAPNPTPTPTPTPSPTPNPSPSPVPPPAPTPRPDTTKPSVTITSPRLNATVRGTITVKAAASDNQGVTGVWFWYDNASWAYGSDASSPYSKSLNTRQLKNGWHALKATAYDAAGNNTTSTVWVNVRN